MAKESQSIPNSDIQKITDCSLYRDSGVSFNSHYFCVDCSEKLAEGVPCPLCRPFLEIPDDRHDGVPRNYLADKLEDLHQLFLEKSLNITGEKRFDTPMVEQFGIRKEDGYFVKVAWLENKIYVVTINVKRVRVFADRAPFNELPEGIEMEGLITPMGLVTCAANRSIFISDMCNQCIWKIQMPSRELIRWDIHSGSPTSLSITPDMELLAVVDDDDDEEEDGDIEDDEDDCNCEPNIVNESEDEDDDEENNEEDNEERYITSLRVYRLADGSLTRSMRLPIEVQYVSCAAELPNKTFVISYSKNTDDQQIGILSTNGESLSVIRILDLGFFESIKVEPWRSSNKFVVKDDGEIFFVDFFGGRVIWFNSKLTDYRIISNNDCQPVNPSIIVYIKEKQQLMVCGDEVDALVPGPNMQVTVFHLSPCSLAEERSATVTGEN